MSKWKLYCGVLIIALGIVAILQANTMGTIYLVLSIVILAAGIFIFAMYFFDLKRYNRAYLEKLEEAREEMRNKKK